MLTNTFTSVVLSAALSFTMVLPLAAQTDERVTEAPAFARTAASSNIFEIQSSQLALERLQGGDIAAFAEDMVADHTAAGERLSAIAMEDNATVPTVMLENHQVMLRQLEAAEGDTFEQAYVEAQVTAHEEAVALFTVFSEQGQESALKQFATETLPTLQDYEARIKDLAGR